MNSIDDDDDDYYEKSNSKLTKDNLNRSTSMSDNLSIPTKSMYMKAKPTSCDSITPSGRNTVLARAELWDRRISTNDQEVNQPVTTYDIEKWSTEFEKIQNQN